MKNSDFVIGMEYKGFEILSNPFHMEGDRESHIQVKCLFCGKEYIKFTSHLKNRTTIGCGCKQVIKGKQKSLYDWCVENNRMDINDRFDEELNQCTTKDVPMKSNKQFYFKCPRGLHDSELQYIKTVTKSGDATLRCHACESIGQKIIDNFGEEFLWKRWSHDNKKSPFEISKSSKQTVILQCQNKEYHVYEQPAKMFGEGYGCPYCNSRQIHPIDSLGGKYPDIITRWSDKNLYSPFEYSTGTRKKVWLKCPNGIHEDYEQEVCLAVRCGFNCHQCSIEASKGPVDLIGLKFGHLTVVSLDSESPQVVSETGYIRYRWWCQCDCGNPQLKSVLGCHLVAGNIRSCGCMSPKNSTLEENVTTYIEDAYNYEILHEYNCSIIPINPKTNRKMPFDNDVILPNNQHLIIEVHGEQHFRITPFTTMGANRAHITPEEQLADQQWRDEYKKQYALSHGYYYLEIPYYTEKDDSYKQLIDDKINSILTIQNDCSAKEVIPDGQFK